MSIKWNVIRILGKSVKFYNISKFMLYCFVHSSSSPSSSWFSRTQRVRNMDKKKKKYHISGPTIQHLNISLSGLSLKEKQHKRRGEKRMNTKNSTCFLKASKKNNTPTLFHENEQKYYLKRERHPPFILYASWTSVLRV